LLRLKARGVSIIPERDAENKMRNENLRKCCTDKGENQGVNGLGVRGEALGGGRKYKKGVRRKG